jgi:hypothetical protein
MIDNKEFAKRMIKHLVYDALGDIFYFVAIIVCYVIIGNMSI